MTAELVQGSALVPKNTNLKERFGRSAFARIAAVSLLTVGTYIATETYEAPAAQATTFSNDYPDGSMPCEHSPYNVGGSCANYDWGPVHTEAQNDSSENSSRGYGYRNCTDGVAYWVNKYTGVSLPHNLGNGKAWDDNATAYTVYDGTNTNSIEPGDIAQSDDGGYGHVGFVTAVSKDANNNVISFDTAELNKNGDGNYTANTYSSKNSLGKFSRGGSYDWDHFIDVNGVNKGLDGGSLGGGAQTVEGGFTGDWNGDGLATVAGAKNDNGAMQWYLRDSNSGGNADVIFHFGSPGDMQVSGDWNGDGKTSVGVVRNIGGVLHWYLTDYNQENPPVNYSFDFGGTGDIPVVGDWTHSGHAEIGVVSPTSGGLIWRLKNAVNGGNADNTFSYGANGDIPVTGDWNGDHYSSVGVVRKDATGPNWYLTNFNQANPPINYGPFYYGSNDMMP